MEGTIIQNSLFSPQRTRRYTEKAKCWGALIIRSGHPCAWSAKAQREAHSFCSAHPCASPLRGLRANLLLADLCSAHPCASPLRGLRANPLPADLCSDSKSFASLRFWTPILTSKNDDQALHRLKPRSPGRISCSAPFAFPLLIFSGKQASARRRLGLGRGGGRRLAGGALVDEVLDGDQKAQAEEGARGEDGEQHPLKIAIEAEH